VRLVEGELAPGRSTLTPERGKCSVYAGADARATQVSGHLPVGVQRVVEVRPGPVGSPRPTNATSDAPGPAGTKRAR